jgi:hypothetical protein
VQPSQLIGNIHNIADDFEPVIGYISVGTTQTKRIYINKHELPINFITKYPYNCRIDTAETTSILIPLYSPYIAINRADPSPGFLYSDRICGDCTIRGTVQKPAFWQ